MDASKSSSSSSSSPSTIMSSQQSHIHYRHNKLIIICIAVVGLILACHIPSASSLLCYKCTSSEPGCTLNQVDWMIHSAMSCPGNNDKCVKIIEQRGADVRITRSCLSAVMPYRRDIPADHYEGCRPATHNPSRAQYVFNEIKELELRNKYYNNVTYCFCEFDHWCNSVRGQFGGGMVTFAMMMVAIVAVGQWLERVWRR